MSDSPEKRRDKALSGFDILRKGQLPKMILGLAQPENTAIKRFEFKFGFRFLRQILVNATVIYDLSELTPEDVIDSD